MKGRHATLSLITLSHLFACGLETFTYYYTPVVTAVICFLKERIVIAVFFCILKNVKANFFEGERQYFIKSFFSSIMTAKSFSFLFFSVPLIFINILVIIKKLLLG